jgi:hypothetical protein
VLYGLNELDDRALEDLRQWVELTDGIVRLVPHLHAKVVICGGSSCITNYSFLWADPFGTASHAREIGVALEGEEPASWLYDALATVEVSG